MKPHLLLKLAAGLVSVFALGHTYGMVAGTSRGLAEDAVMAAMQAFRFDLMGTERTHFEMYQGYGWFMAASAFLLVVALWQAGSLVRQFGTAVRPLVVTLGLGCAAYAALSAAFFFAVPALACGLGALAVGAALFAPAGPTTAAAQTR